MKKSQNQSAQIEGDSEIGTGTLDGATCSSIEFICAACGDGYAGDPIIRNGCQLCSDCQNSPLFTVRDIAKYIAGWTMGSFEEVRKLGQHVAHNALHQLSDDQDGIEACRSRNNSQTNAKRIHPHSCQYHASPRKKAGTNASKQS